MCESTGMDAATLVDTDALSDVFEQVEVQGLVTGGFAVRGPWATRTEVSHPFKLVALVAGSAHVVVDGPGGREGPVEMGAADVLLLNHRTHLEAWGGSSGAPTSAPRPDASFDSMALSSADLTTDDVLVGGWIQVNAAGQSLLAAALPGLVHVRASSPSAAQLVGLVARLFHEASSHRLGSAFAIRQNGQLILLEVLRAYMEQEQPPVGWIRLLADEPLAPALRLLHGDPSHAWRLADLARAAGMSRTTFAERFRAISGTSPLAYLSRWRILLAQRALRNPDVRVGALAVELGYGSESAFSTAFKREIGEAPLHYRLRLHGTK